MIRNLKILLAAGLAVLALGAIGASSASANFITGHTAATVFTNVNGGNTVLTTEADGTGTTAHQVFDVPGNGPLTCNSVDLEGTVSAGSQTSVTLIGRGAEPFTSCLFVGLLTTVNLNGCDFVFELPTTMKVSGCGGKEITFAAAGCTVHVPEQTIVGHTTYRNLGTGGNDMYVTASIVGTNITSNATGAGCLTVGDTSTGTYTTGNVLIKGHADPAGAQKPITVH